MAENSPAQLIEFIAKGIVSQPEAVAVREAEGGVLQLETAQPDRGRVIGRQGRIAKAMRAVLGATRRGRGLRMDIVD